MSASTRTVDPNDRRLTEVPQRILFVPPAPTTPYELGLLKYDLKKQAIRVAVNRVIMKICNSAKERTDISDTWGVPLYTTMLRSERHHAGELAKRQEVHYGFFRGLAKSQFTRIDIQFLSFSGCADEIACDRRDIRKIRRIVDKIISAPKFNKIGSWQHRVFPMSLGIRLKFIVSARVAESVRDEINAALAGLDTETKISTWRVFDRENFAEEIKSVVAPDLPPDGALRAEFEFLLQGLAQISHSGLSEEDAARFALTSQDNANLSHSADADEEAPTEKLPPELVELGKIRLSHVPRSPKTGKPARFISIAVDRDTKPEDLDPSEWLEIIPPS